MLLRQRTDTGWHIDAKRLVDILTFRCPFLSAPLHIKLWGDGREIGGRHSTVMGLSILNNEMHLRNTSFQSPHHTYPFGIFL